MADTPPEGLVGHTCRNSEQLLNFIFYIKSLSGLPLLTPLLLKCARTVSEPQLFHPWALLFERKQIPRFVVSIRNSGKAMEPMEATQLPCSQARYRLGVHKASVASGRVHTESFTSNGLSKSFHLGTILTVGLRAAVPDQALTSR